MPDTKPDTPTPQRQPEAPWTEEEKKRGAAKPGDASAAGAPTTSGRPTDDRAATESAAAQTDPGPDRRP